MAFNPYLHYEYFQSAIPDYKWRCRRCGGGPVMLSMHSLDHCLNCSSYALAEPIFRFGEIWPRLKIITAKCISKIRGMPKTKVDPFFRLTEGLDL